MADGVDTKELARRYKAANAEGRRTLIRRYIAWIFEGARAQGWYRVGLIVLGASAVIALDAMVLGGAVWIYALCLVGGTLGAWLTTIAFRRERDWRRSHPFQYGDGDAQVH